MRMLGEGGTALSKLLEAIREFQAREDRRVDLKGLRVGIDALEAEFSVEARTSQLNGDNLADGSAGAVTWLSRLCGMSVCPLALFFGRFFLASPRDLGHYCRVGQRCCVAERSIF